MKVYPSRCKWGEFIHHIWINNLLLFSGESVDDCGGGYSESIAEMCDELQNGSLPLLIVTPNGRDESGANRDCFLLNPMIRQNIHQNMFKFLGKLIEVFIAPAYSRVRYRSSNFHSSVHLFFRPYVQSVNIYVEVWFSLHQ